MKITPSFPVSEMQGSTRNSQLTFSTVQGEVIARAKVTPANPQTAEQQAVRSFLTTATKTWSGLDAAEREAWDAYARTFFDSSVPTTSPGLTAFVRCNTNRQLLGLPLALAAPSSAPPAPLQSIEASPAQNPDTLQLELQHTLAPAGLVVVVRMTPAMVSLARKPQERDYRYVRGAGAASTAVLPASGGTVVFTPTRYEIPDGRRFGVEVRVVRTSDGVPSAPIYGDFIKMV